MLIDVKENETGFLLPINFKDLPYDPKRAFIIKNKFAGAIRGRHAHKIDKQIIICLGGFANIKYENKNGTGCKQIKFGDVYISKEHEWLEIEMIEKETVLFVLCSIEYDDSEYIRDYEEFISIIGKK
jgi:hypothetical protein